jgi:hypothetical protein
MASSCVCASPSSPNCGYWNLEVETRSSPGYDRQIAQQKRGSQILEPSRPDVDEVGDLLFGRKLRLRLALWVLRRDDRFYQAEAAKGVNYSASAVADELDRLVELGMLAGQPAESGDRRRYYKKLDHPLWAIIEAVDAAVGTGGTGESPDTTTGLDAGR